MLDSMRFDGAPLKHPYVTAGDRLYAIGGQDGRFPAIGDHVAGEMGGIWAHPIKLADGFDLRINGERLPAANRYTTGAYWSEFEYSASESISVTRRQFVPDGESALVVSYQIQSKVAKNLDVAFSVVSDLQPVWLADQEGIEHGETVVEFDDELSVWQCRDDSNEWFVLVGAVDLVPYAHTVGGFPEQVLSHGHGFGVNLDYRLSGARDVTVAFLIVGGAGDVKDFRQAYRRVAGALHEVDRAKESRYEAMINRSRLSVPDQPIDRVWDWLKCNNDWLVRDVEGVGRGIGAGAPEYVWWFGCDTAYAVPSLLALGQADIARDTLDLLRSLSCAGGETSGRVIHEATTSGQVAHPGCTEETAQFTGAVREVVLWTGDRAFLERNYDFCRRGLLDWVLATMDPDGCRMPSGYGIVEIEGLDLHCLDVMVHTISALDALADLAAILGDTETIARCTALEPLLRSRLENEFWVESVGMYADVVGSSSEMLPRLRSWRRRHDRANRDGLTSVLDGAIIVAESDPEPYRLRPWILGNWTAVCPLDAELSPVDRARRVLERLEQPDHSRRWGMAVNGFDPESVVMTIPTGALASAEAACGRWDQALRYVAEVVATVGLGMPGAISEISPDAGCFVQAWSAYAVTQPLVRHMFGFRPDAIRRQIQVEPSFPPGWDSAALRNLPVGSTTCDLVWERGQLRVSVAEDGWDIAIGHRGHDGQGHQRERASRDG